MRGQTDRRTGGQTRRSSRELFATTRNGLTQEEGRIMNNNCRKRGFWDVTKRY